MFGGFDFVKAGKITSVMLKGGRAGVRKLASAAYAELEHLAQEDQKEKEDFAAAKIAVESTTTKKEGETNGSV